MRGLHLDAQQWPAHALDIAVEGEVGALAEMTIDGTIDTSIDAMPEVGQAVDFARRPVWTASPWPWATCTS